jgi:hypothetical protein
VINRRVLFDECSELHGRHLKPHARMRPDQRRAVLECSYIVAAIEPLIKVTSPDKTLSAPKLLLDLGREMLLHNVAEIRMTQLPIEVCPPLVGRAAPRRH